MKALFLLTLMLTVPFYVYSSEPYLVKDIYPGNETSPQAPQDLIAIGNTLYFAAYAQNMGVELWKSNGTNGGTLPVKDVCPGSGSSDPMMIGSVNGLLIFEAWTGSGTRGIWRSDGTASGTYKIKDIRTSWWALRIGNRSLRDEYALGIGKTLYFIAYDPSAGSNSKKQIWKTDGTAVGTSEISPVSREYEDPHCLTSINGILFFAASAFTQVQSFVSVSRELWKSDGSSAGTALVDETHLHLDPDRLTNVNGTLFFKNGEGLGKSDGTAIGTKLFKQFQSPQNLANVNGKLFYTCDDSIGIHQLWKSDGTTTGTIMVKDFSRNSSINPRYLTSMNGTLYYAADDSFNGIELWKSDSITTDTVMIKDIYPGASSNPQNLICIGNTLYFSANDGVNGNELWKSDGQSNGTYMIKDIYPGSFGSQPQNLTNLNGTLFFVAGDATNGTELWAYDTGYHPGPPSTPQGSMEVTYHLKTPSVSPDGQPVQYIYLWTSDKGDRVTHGPTSAISDTLTEMNLVQDGETWTVRVTPTVGSLSGTAATASVKFVDIHSGVMVWSFYK